MPTPERVIEALRARRELWEPAPGLLGLRGDAAALRLALANEIAQLTRVLGEDEWEVPPAIPLAALARADYFVSFPRFLTAVSHLGAETGAAVAGAADPAAEARAALVASDVALPPAVCYHVYAALAGQRLNRAVRVSAACTCWRREAGDYLPLGRGWAFTMREAVCVGTAQETETFRKLGAAAGTAFAKALGLPATTVQAEDPFFLPTARGRALLQRIKALKHELVLEQAGAKPLAIASFNHHERFFGDAFEITVAADGSAASSACIAFGVERWLLGFLMTHGPDARGWPDVRGAATRALMQGAPADDRHSLRPSAARP